MSAYTMAVIEVTPGVNFAYMDSGPPSGEDVYTTLLIIHGYGWNANTFRKVVDIAPKYGVRVIALHRRDYGGSTPFTEAEVGPIEQTTPEPAAVDAFMTARALELANFVQHVIESKAAVAPCDGKGGIALLGWSLGNLYGLDFLLRFRGLSDHLQAPIKIFVRSFVIFDASIEALAIPPPTPAQEMYVLVVFNRHLAKAGVDPAAANPADVAAANDAVSDWISGWFEYTAADRATTDPVMRYVAPNERSPVRTSTRMREAGNPVFEACAETAPTSKENVLLSSLLPAVAAGKAFHPLLFEDPGRTLWEGMRVEMVYAANSLWSCVYTAGVVRERFERAVPGRRMREIPVANHFVQWENPEKFLEHIKAIL